MQQRTEERFLALLRQQLGGVRHKATEDFARLAFEKELAGLRGDSVYSRFGLGSPQYALIRLMGRMSISIGRRLGEIYDQMPRFIAAARFNLQLADVALVFDHLILDVGIEFAKLTTEDRTIAKAAVRRHFDSFADEKGVGIEVRYNFNPNDSSRLRKDDRMADLVRQAGLFPVYLVFSSISPRHEAIARLQRAGWHFRIGADADSFIKDLIGMDIGEILDRPKVQEEVKTEVDAIMKSIMTSYAFDQAVRTLARKA